jgi:hypothetical protein
MKYLFFISCIYTCCILLSCSGSKEFVKEKPQEGMCLLVGAMLVENKGIEDRYESLVNNIHVVLVGKHMQNGEEKTDGYKVKTDANGYFLLQNVPPGSYVLKGFEVDVGFNTRLFVTSRWDGNSQIFYPGTSNVIDYTVRVWPEPYEGKFINLGINYFMIDQAMRIANNRFNVLDDKPGALSGVTYTMKNPLDYFKTKYPQWEWFK